MPPPPDASVEFYKRGQQITGMSLVALRELWRRFRAGDINGSFGRLTDDLVALLAASQLAAVQSAQVYLPAVLAETGIDAPPAADIDPVGFVGASSGVTLETLLGTVPAAALSMSKQGAGLAAIEQRTLALAEGIWQTQIADAARQATSVGMAARPRVTGWVRMLNPPACSRCAILAGRRYRWSDGFARHPRCDCRHIPAAEDSADDYRTDPNAYFRSLPAAEQDRLFGKGPAQAIRDGGDMSRVVNATGRRAGMTVAGQFTREAPTAGRLRLTPEAIYGLAGSDRGQALTLLRREGYLT